MLNAKIYFRPLVELTTPSVDNQAQKMARKLLTGEVTMSEIEPDLQKTGNPNIDTQIDEFRYLLAHYYEQFLKNGF